MIITRKSLARRTFLKGIGAAIGLPVLDAMSPAFAASKLPGKAPVRAAWFYVPNGIDMRHWTPAEEGALGTAAALDGVVYRIGYRGLAGHAALYRMPNGLWGGLMRLLKRTPA